MLQLVIRGSGNIRLLTKHIVQEVEGMYLSYVLPCSRICKSFLMGHKKLITAASQNCIETLKLESIFLSKKDVAKVEEGTF